MVSETRYETQRIDHLGIVAGICYEIGLIEVIDQQVGARGQKVSCGQGVQAMVLYQRFGNRGQAGLIILVLSSIVFYLSKSRTKAFTVVGSPIHATQQLIVFLVSYSSTYPS